MQKLSFIQNIQEKILLENKISKIKSESLKNYLNDFFKLKVILLKLLTIFLTTLICATLFFVLRSNSLEQNWDNVEFNKGVAFGIGNDWDLWIVYALKIVPFILMINCFIFFNQWYIFMPFCVMAMNSLFNIIDKALVDEYRGVIHYDAVVDNIRWTAFGFTNNVADIFIVISLFFTISGILYHVYKIFKNDKEESQKTNIEEDNKERGQNV
ncbi:MAG: hypothetical protein ACRC42_01360 [Mycoplasma sp.]